MIYLGEQLVRRLSEIHVCTPIDNRNSVDHIAYRTKTEGPSHEPPQLRQARPGHPLPGRGQLDPLDGTARWRSPRHDHAAHGGRWRRLRAYDAGAAARPGMPPRPGGRDLDVRREEAEAVGRR